MTDFWNSRTGDPISGSLEDAAIKSFEIIPEGTTAKAQIIDFLLVTKTFDGVENSFYEITWTITEGPFKGRQLNQKIKAMDDKDSIAQRGLNILKRLYTLCNHTPKHGGMPTDADHLPFTGKHLGLKIGQWSMPKRKEPGFMEGNYVTELHPIDANFVVETGIRKELPVAREAKLESAFSRNPRAELEVLDDDVPF
jgi:hypothetical protein